MTEAYRPSDNDVRHYYYRATAALLDDPYGTFDRWLRQVKAEVLEEAAAVAMLDAQGAWRWAAEATSDWLKDRASRIRRDEA
jgi:hypothetical protein